MQPVQGSSWGNPAHRSASRRMAARVARFAGGVALTAALLGVGGIQPAAAQDEIVLTAGGSTLTVSPGNASAVSAVAEAHASHGHAETIAAGARAVADCVDGALAEGSAALAVAHPDEGALVEAGTVTTMTPEDMAADIMSRNSAVQMIADSNRDDDSPIRKNVEDRCGKEEKKIEPPKQKEAPPAEIIEEVVVVHVPATGAGSSGMTALSSLFGAAAAAAALGAVGLRVRQPGQLEALAIKAGRIR